MTEPSAPERDEAGRFVKPPEAASPPDDSEMHPAAKLLFGWVSHPRTHAILLAAVIALSVFLVVIDLVTVRHEYVEFSEGTGFYALWGFAAFTIAVLSGWPLGKLLRRREDYYDEADTRPTDVDDAAGPQS